MLCGCISAIHVRHIPSDAHLILSAKGHLAYHPSVCYSTCQGFSEIWFVWRWVLWYCAWFWFIGLSILNTPGMTRLPLLLIWVCALRPFVARRSLYSNQLSGTVPSQLGALASLTGMCVERNIELGGCTKRTWEGGEWCVPTWVYLLNHIADNSIHTSWLHRNCTGGPGSVTTTCTATRWRWPPTVL